MPDNPGHKKRRIIICDGIPIPQVPPHKIAGGETKTWDLDLSLYHLRATGGQIKVDYYLCFEPIPRTLLPPPTVRLNDLIPPAFRANTIIVPAGARTAPLTVTAGTVPGAHYVLIVVTAEGRSDFMRLKVRGPALRNKKGRKRITPKK
ncbi:MAG: hypothetical protein HZC36_05200 [Armatimonadetes bacterium]|nr:hypothetical protein [Armatimonadota bacterium]